MLWRLTPAATLDAALGSHHNEGRPIADRRVVRLEHLDRPSHGSGGQRPAKGYVHPCQAGGFQKRQAVVVMLDKVQNLDARRVA